MLSSQSLSNIIGTLILISETDSRHGAGTGIFTRALFNHPEWKSSVKEYRALEPSSGMRDEFTKTVQNDVVSVHDGAFTDMSSVEDGWADIIIIAQVREDHYLHTRSSLT